MIPERLLLGPGPSPVSARVMRRDGGAGAEPSRSRDDGDPRRHPRAPRLDVRRRRRCAQPGDLRHRHVGHGSGRRQRHARPARACWWSSPDISAIGWRRFRALRRDGDARRRRVGTRLRPGRGRARARRGARRHRGGRARRDVDRRAQPGADDRADRRARRRADGRRRGDVAGARCRSKHSELGHRRLLQLHAERPRRAVRPGADLVFGARARERARTSRSFYLDLALLEDYWVRRKYHHTMSAPLVYALREALAVVEEEGLEARWARHERNHRALAAGLEALGLAAAAGGRAALDAERRARCRTASTRPRFARALLDEFSIEIGAGLGSARRKIWRVGLMGAGSTLANVLLFLTALERVLRRRATRPRLHRGCDRARRRARVGAATAGLVARGQDAAPSGDATYNVTCAAARGCARRRIIAALLAVGFACAAYIYLTLPDVRVLRTQNPGDHRVHRAARTRRRRDKGEPPRRVQRWVPYARISPNLKRAVLVTEDARSGSTTASTTSSSRSRSRSTRAHGVRARRQHDHAAARQEPLPVAVEEPDAQVRELLIARRLEAELTKQRILEIYLNVIEWGDGIYGAEAAARTLLRQVGGRARRRQNRRCSPARSSIRAARSRPADGAAAPAAADDPAPDGRRDAAAGGRRADVRPQTAPESAPPTLSPPAEGPPSSCPGKSFRRRSLPAPAASLPATRP